MININLIIKPNPKLRWRVVLRTVLAVVLLVAVGAAGYGGWQRLERLRIERAAVERLLAAYKMEGKGLAETQAAVAEAEGFLAGVGAIGRNQEFSQAAALELLWQRPPSLRLTKVTFTGREAAVTGDAPTFAAANQYLLDLRARPPVEAVTEVAAERIATGETTFTYLVRFREEVGQP